MENDFLKSFVLKVSREQEQKKETENRKQYFRELGKKGGLKKKSANQLLRVVSVRFTEKEYIQLKSKCDAAGMKMEPFLRALVSGCTLRERPPDSYKALASQVAAIGNNLNQLTRLANSTGKIENAQIAEANRMMQRIWQLMREEQ